MMAKRKRRAAGGGRKPQGEFSNLTVPFSMRMPESLRKELEDEANARGRSASQELLRRLQNSLERDRDRERDPALRGLLFFVAQIAENISLGDLVEDERQRSRLITGWRTNPFLFRAFKFAITKFLDKLSYPPGRVYPPFDPKILGEDDAKSMESPEACADWILEMLWTKSFFLDEGIVFEGDPARPHATKALEREHYGLPRARKALELNKKQKELTDAQFERILTGKPVRR